MSECRRSFSLLWEKVCKDHPGDVEKREYAYQELKALAKGYYDAKLLQYRPECIKYGDLQELQRWLERAVESVPRYQHTSRNRSPETPDFVTAAHTSSRSTTTTAAAAASSNTVESSTGLSPQYEALQQRCGLGSGTSSTTPAAAAAVAYSGAFSTTNDSITTAVPVTPDNLEDFSPEELKTDESRHLLLEQGTERLKALEAACIAACKRAKAAADHAKNAVETYKVTVAANDAILQKGLEDFVVHMTAEMLGDDQKFASILEWILSEGSRKATIMKQQLLASDELKALSTKADQLKADSLAARGRYFAIHDVLQMAEKLEI